MDRTAADEVEAQTPHSLSALMQAHATTSKNFYRYSKCQDTMEGFL